MVRYVLRSLSATLTGCALGAVIALSISLLGGVITTSPGEVNGWEAFIVGQPDPVVMLLNEHDCWTGPSDRVAHSAVITLPRGRLMWTGDTGYNADWFKVALDHLFTKPVPGLIVHGFCA